MHFPCVPRHPGWSQRLPAGSGQAGPGAQRGSSDPGPQPPSGDPEPSNADRHLTHKLMDALNLVDVRTLDHIVVGNEGCLSMVELGHM